MSRRTCLPSAASAICTDVTTERDGEGDPWEN
jgi:hypothetical protein